MLKELTDCLLALMQAEANKTASIVAYKAAIRTSCQTLMRWKRSTGTQGKDIASVAKVGQDRVCRHIHMTGYLSSDVVIRMLRAAIQIHQQNNPV